MNSFDRTPEATQSRNMIPACNRVLREVFGVTDDHIIRYTQEDGPHILDQEFAIDLKVVTPCGAQLSGQEKALSNKFYKYRTFTMEFFQNRHTQEPGEFFKIASQFYLSGYSDDTGFEFVEWHIIKMFDFINWIRGVPTKKLAMKCKPSGPSRAAFLPVPYDSIPNRLIYASGFGPGDTEIYGQIKHLQQPHT